MPELTKKDEDRMVPGRGRGGEAGRGAGDVVRRARGGRGERTRWGSLTLAVERVALGRGRELDGLECVEDDGHELGEADRDRRIRDAFTKLASFGDTAERVRESRIRSDHLVATLEDVTGAVERLWDLAPGGDFLPGLTPDEPDELEEMDGGPDETD